MLNKGNLTDTIFYLELNVPGIDKNMSPTCIWTFLYVKLGVIEG